MSSGDFKARAHPSPTRSRPPLPDRPRTPSHLSKLPEYYPDPPITFRIKGSPLVVEKGNYRNYLENLRFIKNTLQHKNILF